MLDEGVVCREIDLAREAELGTLGLGALELHGPVGGIHVLHAVERLEEVEVPHSAAELTVGHSLEAGLPLGCDELGDGLVLDRGQLVAIDLALGELCTGFLEVGGAQEAADDIVGVGRLLEILIGHIFS